jgi:LmbE family N-acetylglucosaminyl deacetylase
MLGFPLGTFDGPLRRLLVIGCHADDAEIGCGGTLLQLIETVPGLEVTWVVLAVEGDRVAEAAASAEAFVEGAGSTDIRILGFRDGFLPYQGAEVKEVFEALKDVQPDLVLTHARGDLHQDHRLACELSWNTFRDTLILEYEVPKYDGDLGAPNVFVPVSAETVARKTALIERFFASQRDKHWFTADLFASLMRIRGMECRSPTGYAEAFHGRKLRLTTSSLY